MIDVKPGIYTGISEEEYSQWDAVRQSNLRYLAHSPALYQQKILRPELIDDVTTTQQATFDLGHLAHLAVFQPQLLESEVICLPGTYPVEKAVKADVEKGFAMKAGEPCDRPWGGGTSNWCKQWKEDHADKLIAKREDVAVFQSIARKMQQNPGMAPFIGLEPHEHEVGLIWDDPETGIRCKAKLDSWPGHGNKIGDLKTLGKSADPDAFIWHAMDFGYFRQAAWYLAGISVLGGPEFNRTTATFRFLLCEKFLPYRVCYQDVLLCPPAGSDNDPVGYGRMQNRHLLAVLKHCRDNDHYPEWNHNPNGLMILEENHKNKMERNLTKIT